MSGKKGIRNVAGMINRPKGGRRSLTAREYFQQRVSGSLVEDVGAWLAYLAERGYSRTSVDTYGWGLKMFLLWTTEQTLYEAQAITRRELEHYQSWLYLYRQRNGSPLSIRSQLTRLTAVQRFFSWMNETGRLAVDPSVYLRLPRKPCRGLPKVLSRLEIANLMAQANYLDPLGLRDRTILELFYATGIRRSELVFLDLFDIDLSEATVFVRQGKGGRDRLLPLGNETVRWLNAYLKKSRPRLCREASERALFITGYGTRFNPGSLGNWVGRTMRAAGITKRGACHLLRHSCATHMMENGADLRCIQQLLGHARLDTTQIYTEVGIVRLREVYNRTHPSTRKL
ncbi:tyrosine-type recombinase/integrase [Coraliomargarita parva]|uniref:tyrosine-type recombinase/integrase n=1 Tax=Coraliomargarita parva TaxID=3014050 RepID=UPI0022B2F4A2|nr:tyrosine-type recombinase/integrase [Coraliomargarita parva]